MDGPGSISIWLGQLKAGDSDALGPLWQRYFTRLAGMVRDRLRARPSRASDEEDVALSAFDSFCRGVGRGRFPRLEDRDDLWQVLLLLARQKALDLLRSEGRQKRGGGKVLPASALAEGETSSVDALAEFFGAEPTPEFAAEVAEEYRRLLDLLGDPELRAVAVWKMEGYSNDEIAAKIQRSIATVERKLNLIRKIWGQAIR